MMHRAVRSIIPQEVAMFDFLKQKDRTPPVLPEGTVRRHFSISGQVQGVGFRYRARYAAQALELTGWVENEDDGSVTLEKRRTQVRPPFCSFYLQPAILRGELAVQRVPSSSRVSASVPLAETRAGSSA